ncbi:hypothetical protein GXM_06004 [Nostoc sphaeroides CCNUC1]|uniref:Uncharacterized protein n=1 Tax=Nostoc sphaeroides CCNUC1 TaxID=2653204 RepID=A0A5P8W785_9NOSO|nr:hypothetical protein GXM_06004 [Nostoc sphaeroides CCNUC1]
MYKFHSPKKMLLSQLQQGFQPISRLILIRATFEMLIKIRFQPLNFPGTLSKRIL